MSSRTLYRKFDIKNKIEIDLCCQLYCFFFFFTVSRVVGMKMYFSFGVRNIFLKQDVANSRKIPRCNSFSESFLEAITNFFWTKQTFSDFPGWSLTSILTPSSGIVHGIRSVGLTENKSWFVSGRCYVVHGCVLYFFWTLKCGFYLTLIATNRFQQSRCRSWGLKSRFLVRVFEFST